MKKTSLIVGTIGSVFFMLIGIVYVLLPVIFGSFSSNIDVQSMYIPRIIGFAFIGYGLIGLILSLFSLKSKTCCVMLVILGVPFLIGLFGIFYVIAGVKGVNNHKALKESAKQVELSQEEAQEITAEAAPAEATSFVKTSFAEEDDGEIDISRETRPKGHRFGGKWYPSKGWFAENGIPVKEIPVDKRTLKSMSDEQKYVVALSTFSILKIKAIFIIVTFIVCLTVGFTVSATADGDGFWGYVFTVLIMLFGVGFIVTKPARLIDGFTIVNGTFKDRIGLPWYWDLVFAVASFIGGIWSFFPSVIFILFDMTRREKMMSLPRVGVPQNIGMDDMIDVYSAYERACSIDDAFRQSAAASAKRDYDRKQSELDSFKTSVSNSGLSAYDKQAVIEEADRVKRENEKIYNDKIKPEL